MEDDIEREERQRVFEAKQNLVGFFTLLLEIDKRLHPERHKRKDERED